MNILQRLALAVALLIAAISPLRAEPQAVQMLNAMRAQQGVAPLSYAPRLEAAARAHALDMARHGYFSHTGRDGSGVGDRVRAQGYRWCYVAENLAKGQGDLTQVMRGWAQSARRPTRFLRWWMSRRRRSSSRSRCRDPTASR